MTDTDNLGRALDGIRTDADATPSTGSQALHDQYLRILRDAMAGQKPGDHKLV